MRLCQTSKKYLREKDMTDFDEEVFVRAGERVYGNLNYYGETPYIFGEIEDVDPEYVVLS